MTIRTDFLHAMKLLSSTDDSRYVLQSIAFVNNDKGKFLMATDGRLLGMVKLPKETDLPKRDIIIPTEALELLPDSGVVDISFPDNLNILFEVLGNHRFSIKHFLLEGNFPNCHSVFWKSEFKPLPVLHFNLSLLDKFRQVALLLCRSTEVVIAGNGNELDPLLILFPAFSDFAGLLMPMRRENKSEITIPNFI